MSTGSSTTPLQRPVTRRFSQVYVDIPPSPFHKSRVVSGSPLHVHTHSSNRKENAPLQFSSIIQDQDPATSSPNRKRKLSESYTNMNMASVDGTTSLVKKAKVSVNEKTVHKSKTTTAKIGTQQVSEEFPNGWFYCHQCNKKRDSGRKYPSLPT